ncbi:ATPase AAA domain-containing protein 2 [Lecanora helva]
MGSQLNFNILDRAFQWLSVNGLTVWFLTILPGLYHFSKAFFRGLGFEIVIPGEDSNARYFLVWIRKYFNDRNCTNQITSTNALTPSESRTNCWQDLNSGLWKFDNAAGDRKTLFEVGYGKHYFFYEGWPYLFERTKIEGNVTTLCSETLSIRCLFSFSTKPIQRLINQAKEDFLAEGGSAVSIFIPTVKTQQGMGPQTWNCLDQVRRARDLCTVYLDTDMKDGLLEDLNTFLAPKQAQTYEKRGIPYRRGYLFRGPSGTGKTSLVNAIAGTFRLNLYTISLSSQNYTDEDLVQLLSKLPSRCIVLFEDIDQAGLPNREYLVDGTSSGVSQRITLSGFLNAIGGVTTPEGPLFIYTTNKLESLDAALLRPGRVDRIFNFGFARRIHIKALFNRMFDLQSHDSRGDRFASMIPEQTISVADIEEFLLQHQHDPDVAIASLEKQGSIKGVAGQA